MRTTRAWATAAICLAGAWAFWGCSRSDDRSGAAGGSQMITVKGSDTMVHLASAWAEAYMKQHPKVQIAVTGGGSGTGIAAIINGTTDICTASRKIEEEELKQAAENQVQPKEFVAALDGIAVVVNPANPVNELTMEQLRKIYIGVYTNWNEVGGSDERIVLLSRETSSGTYVFFQEHVLQKNDYAQTARLMPATSAIVQEVSSSKGAIGYVGLGYAAEAGDKIKAMKIKAQDDRPAVEPLVETVVSGEYPISRPLNLYTRGEPTGEVKAFIDFCLSADGRKIVTETGFVPAK
ncbi:MAG TPA: phosphate ABC transporter substrate-binding protein [Phycisphaerae bacterium]|nr:phosphate ABC transporter substrate-binding protein [Phycisphaerae bacterium]